MYDDEFAGQGGSYLLDPKTNKRTRVEAPTSDEVPPSAPQPAAKETKPNNQTKGA